MESARRSDRGLRLGFLSALIFLLMQFGLGMAVNLFVTVPTNHPGSNPPEYFSGVAQSVTWAILHGHVLLILHASFGILLVLSAFGLVARAIGARKRSLILTTAFGAFFTLFAGFNGGSYLNYHDDINSMIMASAFGLAVLSYSIGLYVTGSSTRS